jgi:hypothetical protein
VQFNDAIEIDGAALILRVERDLLAQFDAAGRESMPAFKPVPPVVSSAAAGGLADSLCERLGVLCNADVGPDGDEAEMIAVSGDQEARIWIGDGSMDIIDRAVFSPADQSAVPALISPQDAYEKAESVLGAIGINMQDRVLVQQDLRWTDEGLSKDDPDAQGNSFPTTTRVIYRRGIAGYPTFGPGGEATVEFGEQGQLAKASIQTWTDLEFQGDAAVINLQNALEQLAGMGSSATINGLRTPIAEIDVRNVQIGYWLDTATNGDRMVLPSYGIDCLVKNDGGELSEATLVMSAAASAPRVSIVPLEGGCHDVGTQVCFDAYVDTFDGQFAIEWIDPESGSLLGTSTRVCHAFTQGDPDRQVRTRSIKVRARDSHGNETTSTLDVCIGAATDLNGDDITDIDDLLIVLSAWGATGSPWSGGDATGDGVTDINDVLTVLSNLAH